MKNKIHRITYWMEVPDHWWARRQRKWVSAKENLESYIPFSTTRIFRTKTKAFRALWNVRHIPGATITQILNLKDKYILMDSWSTIGDSA